MKDALGKARTALARLLLEFDFMIEDGIIDDIRNDVIFVAAREALTAIELALSPPALSAAEKAGPPITEEMLRDAADARGEEWHPRGFRYGSAASPPSPAEQAPAPPTPAPAVSGGKK